MKRNGGVRDVPGGIEAKGKGGGAVRSGGVVVRSGEVGARKADGSGRSGGGWRTSDDWGVCVMHDMPLGNVLRAARSACTTALRCARETVRGEKIASPLALAFVRPSV